MAEKEHQKQEEAERIIVKIINYHLPVKHKAGDIKRCHAPGD